MFDRALLRLLQLSSPALPVGAYAYSEGLEWAVNESWVHDEATAADWIKGLLQHGVARLDLPLLGRLHRAWSNQEPNEVKRWNRYLYAARESAELRAQERQQGASLIKLLADLEIAEAKGWPAEEIPCFATGFALAATQWQIDAKSAALGLTWSWAENQTAAAVKLIPLGQTAAQRILSELTAIIPGALKQAEEVGDDEIGSSALGTLMASVLHETQYSRLFRS